jgi:hypothetical protein
MAATLPAKIEHDVEVAVFHDATSVLEAHQARGAR